MKNRIVLLKPTSEIKNGVGETVPAWVPFSPYRTIAEENPPILSVIEGDFVPRYAPEKTEADLAPYRIWASVIPTTGREYEEAQKLRAELTYKVKIRFSSAVQSDMKLLYRGKVLNIESVIDPDAASRELQLVCWEVDCFGKEGS